MTSTLSSVTLSEDIIFGGTAGADLLAGVRSTIMRIYTWLFMVGSGTVGGGEVAQKYRNFSSPRLLNLQLWARPKRKQRAPNLVRCPSTRVLLALIRSPYHPRPLIPFIHRYRTLQSSTKLSEWPPTKPPLRRPSISPVSSRYLLFCESQI